MSSEIGSMDAATATLISNLQEQEAPRRRPARACVAAAKQKLADEAREEREERLKASREAKERTAAKKAAKVARRESIAKGGELEGADGPGVEDEDPAEGLDPEVYELRCMWELAAIFNFFRVYKDIINIPLAFDATELESALLEPLTPSFLKDLHICLLKGVPPVSKSLDRSTWAYEVFRKLKDKWWLVASGTSPIEPGIPRGEEEAAYNRMSPNDRVRVLRALVELRNDQEDCRGAMEVTIKEGISPSAIQLQAVGWDAKNRVYWVDESDYVGFRLYRETQVRPKLKVTGIQAPEPEPSKWETVCAQVDDFKRVAERFAYSQNRKEQRLGAFIQDALLAELEEKERQRERRLKKQQRAAEQLQMLLSGPGLAFGRSKRERKQVDYSYDDYDQVIRNATRKGGRNSSPQRRAERENGHAGGFYDDPHASRRSDRRRGALSENGLDSGADMGPDSDATEKRSFRERKPSHRIVEAQETMQAVKESAEDAQPLGEVVYDEEKMDEPSESEEDVADAGEREDKDDEEYMGSNEEDEEVDEDEEDFDPEDEDEEGGGRSSQRRPRHRENGERPTRDGLRQKGRKRYRDDLEDDDSDDLDALMTESDGPRKRPRRSNGPGKRRSEGEQRRPTRERKQVNYAKLDDLDLEGEEGGNEASEKEAEPSNGNGATGAHPVDDNRAAEPSGESSGEDSELYAGEQYGAREEIDGRRVEEREEELSALDVIGNLVKGRAPAQVRASSEQLSEYEPSDNNASEEDEIEDDDED